MRIAAIGFAAMIALSACTGGEGRELAEAEIDEFRQAYGANEFANVYEASSPEMKRVQDKEEFVAFMNAVRRKLGAFESGKTTGWHSNVGTQGHSMVIAKQSQFENGAAAETFPFRITGDEALLVGYNVNSPQLVLQ